MIITDREVERFIGPLSIDEMEALYTSLSMQVVAHSKKGDQAAIASGSTALAVLVSPLTIVGGIFLGLVSLILIGRWLVSRSRYKRAFSERSGWGVWTLYRTKRYLGMKLRK